MSAIPESIGSNILSVALIVPQTLRRHVLLKALSSHRLNIAREFGDYPSTADLTQIAQVCDVVIVDLDEDVERAIGVIESLCSRNASTTVMAYSSRNDSALILRSMRAGARELLIEPLLPAMIAEAFARTAARRPVHSKDPGKVFVFMGSKGGVGVSTIAANFALSLVKESAARVVVVDMDFQLGEVALGLGLTATFSVVDALLNASRLDRDFLATLMIRHSSGLTVLGAPEEYSFFHSPLDDGAGKLFRILREDFDYVVVDTGTCHGHIQEMLFGMANILYLVTEMTVPALRNGHRLISYLSAKDAGRQLQIVINRFNSRHGEIDEVNAMKALKRPINWRVPNAYAAVRSAQDSGVALAMGTSPITRVLAQMARDACGKALTPEKTPAKGFDFFGLRGGVPDTAHA